MIRYCRQQEKKTRYKGKKKSPLIHMGILSCFSNYTRCTTFCKISFSFW